MLTVERLVVGYGGEPVVKGVDLSVGSGESGEVVCILGPSGSGKSTILAAIAGLVRPSAGTVRWDRLDLSDTPPHRRGFGLMFQDHALFPHRDVAGNVAFGLRMQGVAPAAIRRRVADLLTLVGLAGAGDRPVRDLSGGEQQRVALARALAPDPQLLMLDEPLGSLDRSLRDHLADELRAIFSRRDRAVLLVTHDHEEAFALADRVVVLRAGRVEQDGTAMTVWRRPATPFVAEFLGYNVTRAFGGLLAARPDALCLVPTPAAGTVEVTVVASTFRRDHFRIRVRTGAGETLDVAMRGDALPASGTSTFLQIDRTRAVEVSG